jgi:4-amino-4-deoxy-L-arabinose transferase-like glycosyltransferase
MTPDMQIPRFARDDRAWVYAVLAAYAVGFLLFPPRVLLVVDEFQYVGQALAFARGSLSLPDADPLIPPTHLAVASNYPPGTSLLQAPFVVIAGWRGAMLLSLISVILATLITMRWLREQGREPAFALLVPAFFGVAFFGRLAMSDVPSAAVVALALWLVWRAEGKSSWSFLAGLVAGLSILFRETNAVLLAPIFLGALMRRKCVPWALVLGGALGVAIRLIVSYELFARALYFRDSGYGFSLKSLAHSLPQLAVILLVMFPFGALLPFFYRGPRRAEVVTAVTLYVAVFLFYDYNSLRENGIVKGLILTSRYVVPAVPLLALMAADVYPRWFARVPNAVRTAFARLRLALFAGLALVAFAIHPALRSRERAALAIVNVLHERTTPDVPVITNHLVTTKYFSAVYGRRRLILRSFINAADMPRLYHAYGKLNIVFLDRTDSELFREDAARNEAFLAQTRSRCAVQPVTEQALGPSNRLRQFEVSGCRQ